MAEEYHTCCSRAVPKIPFNRVFCLLFFRLVKTRLERSSHKLYVIPDAGFQSVLVSVSILFCRVFVFHLSVFADFFFFRFVVSFWTWEQVDTMIVQAIGLLDELDKEINTYAMRVKEWFGWHFPEMAKVTLLLCSSAPNIARRPNPCRAPTQRPKQWLVHVLALLGPQSRFGDILL